MTLNLFWLFMLAMDLLIPCSILVLGRRMQLYPPKYNTHSGYRTALSRRDRDTWDFAQQYCGRVWVRMGAVLLPLSIFAMVLTLGQTVTAVGLWGGLICLVQCIVMYLAVPLTERALRRAFPD